MQENKGIALNQQSQNHFEATTITLRYFDHTKNKIFPLTKTAEINKALFSRCSRVCKRFDYQIRHSAHRLQLNPALLLCAALYSIEYF